jgi:hypothetical protein
MVLDTTLLAAEAARRKNTRVYRDQIIPLQIGIRHQSFASL